MRFLLLALTLAPLAACASDGIPVGSELLVLGKSSNRLQILHPESGSYGGADLMETGTQPHELVVSRRGEIAVVCNYGTNTLTIYDLPGRKRQRTIDLREHSRPHGIEFLDQRSHVVVTAESTGSLLVVNVGSGRIESTIPTRGELSHMVALSPDRKRAFVANMQSKNVSVIDLESREFVTHVATGSGPEGIDVSPDGNEVWVANRDDDTLTVIDAHSYDVLDTFATSDFPIRVRFTPRGDRVLVSNHMDGEVQVFDADSRKELARIALDLEGIDPETSRPVGVLVEPGGHYAYVAATQADCIAVIDLDDYSISTVLKTTNEPDGMAWSWRKRPFGFIQ